MNIVAFEGLSGKTTHAKALAKRLQDKGKRAVYFSVHRMNMKNQGEKGQGSGVDVCLEAEKIVDAYLSTLEHFEEQGVEYLIVDQYITYLTVHLSVYCPERMITGIDKLPKPGLEFYLKDKPREVLERECGSGSGYDTERFRDLVMLSAAYTVYYKDNESVDCVGIDLTVFDESGVKSLSVEEVCGIVDDAVRGKYGV